MPFQGTPEGPFSVIFMGYGCAEEGQKSITHDLIQVSAEALDGFREFAEQVRCRAWTCSGRAARREAKPHDPQKDGNRAAIGSASAAQASG
jgi:hypothetical protein